MLTSFKGFLPSGACPYLPGREWAQDVLVVTSIAPDEYLRLLDQGYRRSGRYVYRPRCVGCAECRPLRVPVAGFTPSRTQKRILRINRDLAVTVGPPEFDEERLSLQNRYGEERHEDAPLDEDDFRQLFVDSPVPSRQIAYRLDGRLVGLALIDELGPVHSAVYTCYDTTLFKRSLGTFSVLYEIEHARRSGARWLHLGFHVAPCGRMAYKSKFRPCEKLSPGRVWEPFRAAP